MNIIISKINIFLKKKKILIIKNIVNVKNYRLISSYKKENKRYSKLDNLGSLPRTFLSSLIIISIFSILPIVINFTKDRMLASKDFENKSKNNFEKTLEGKSSSIDTELDKKFVFEDIFEFDNMPTDSVRLSASTIEQLFKDTNYDLNKVRKEKLVKPVSLTLLPTEIKMVI